MSREFESLLQTSKLPDWIERESQLADHWLLVMGGTHGDEQGQVEYVQSQMHPGAYPDGTLPIIANRAASEQGTRYTGKQQLMAQYPGRFSWQSDTPGQLTNEDRTAAGITWLASQLADNHLTVDLHQNCHQDVRYVATGQRIELSALAAAYLMDHSDIIAHAHVPFFDTFSDTALAIEETAPQEPGFQEEYFAIMNKRLERISQLGYVGLKAMRLPGRLEDHFNFYGYTKEILLADPTTKEPDQDMLHVLQEIEDAGTGLAYGDVIPLSSRVREVLDLDPKRQYVVCYGDYDNWSEAVNLPLESLHKVGLSDDRQRKLAWGSIMARHTPPELIGGRYVAFTD